VRILKWAKDWKNTDEGGEMSQKNDLYPYVLATHSEKRLNP